MDVDERQFARQQAAQARVQALNEQRAQRAQRNVDRSERKASWIVAIVIMCILFAFVKTYVFQDDPTATGILLACGAAFALYQIASAVRESGATSIVDSNPFFS